eukprot:Sspe_Gene.12191::Locus_4146_Transcript_2_3_Confidence_0.400_Length_2993::g.12191::m.12191
MLLAFTRSAWRPMRRLKSSLLPSKCRVQGAGKRGGSQGNHHYSSPAFFGFQVGEALARCSRSYTQAAPPKKKMSTALCIALVWIVVVAGGKECMDFATLPVDEYRAYRGEPCEVTRQQSIDSGLWIYADVTVKRGGAIHINCTNLCLVLAKTLEIQDGEVLVSASINGTVSVTVGGANAHLLQTGGRFTTVGTMSISSWGSVSFLGGSQYFFYRTAEGMGRGGFEAANLCNFTVAIPLRVRSAGFNSYPSQPSTGYCAFSSLPGGSLTCDGGCAMRQAAVTIHVPAKGVLEDRTVITSHGLIPPMTTQHVVISPPRPDAFFHVRGDEATWTLTVGPGGAQHSPCRGQCTRDTECPSTCPWCNSHLPPPSGAGYCQNSRCGRTCIGNFTPPGNTCGGEESSDQCAYCLPVTESTGMCSRRGTAMCDRPCKTDDECRMGAAYTCGFCSAVNGTEGRCVISPKGRSCKGGYDPSANDCGYKDKKFRINPNTDESHCLPHTSTCHTRMEYCVYANPDECVPYCPLPNPKGPGCYSKCWNAAVCCGTWHCPGCPASCACNGAGGSCVEPQTE